MNAAPAGVNPWVIALVVSLATFMEVLDTTITNVSLSHIAGELSASQDESTWVLTSYLVANGIVLPLSGWLSDVIGRKRFFMGCIALFTIASFACGAATSLGELIFFRLLQGLAGGGLQPTQQAIILDAFPPEKRGAVFGMTGITLIVAPILGPTLGGWITDNYSWRWIFFINVPVGIFAYLMVARVVAVDAAIDFGKRHIDSIGLGLIAIGLGALQIVMDKGQQDDWFESNFIIAMSLLSAVSLIGAVVWLLNQEDPIVDLKLLKYRSFSLSILLIFFTGFALYGSSALLPLMVQTQFGYNATLAGLVLSPGAMVLLFLMPISGKLIGKFQARRLISFGAFLLAFGMWTTTQITPQTDYNTFVYMRLMQVLGLPFLFIPVSVMAFMDIPKNKSNKASALYALARNLGGSMGIAILGSYVSRHTQKHQAYMVEHLQTGDPVFEHQHTQVTNAFIAHGQSALQAGHSATGRIYQELLHQASILAYHDAYVCLCVIFVLGLFLTLFLPANRTGASAEDAAAAAH